MARRALPLLPAMLCCPALAGCAALGHGFLAPGGPIAAATRHEFLLVCLVMLFVAGPVLLLVPIFAWHYRLANTNSAYRPQWGFSWRLEGLIWIPPTLIVIGLAVLLWRDTHRLDPYRKLPGDTLDIEVVALDWKWLFIYPAQGIATANRLVIPAGRPIHLSLTSATVMQSLLMPRLAGQIYAMAGMRTQLNFAASAPGQFLGENTQFNGPGFQAEKFPIDAMDSTAFAHWVAATKALPSHLDAATYAALTQRATLPSPRAYGTVDPTLFSHILAPPRIAPAHAH